MLLIIPLGQSRASRPLSRRPDEVGLPNRGQLTMILQDDLSLLRHQPLRGTDSNSLLRLYDHAKSILATSRSRQQREWADRAVRRVSAELQRRRVRP